MNTSEIISIFVKFLDRKTVSILDFAAAMAIGYSFKDLITTIVNNFVQPLVVKLIVLINIGHLSKMINSNSNNIFTAENGVLNFSNVVVSTISFILIVTTVFFMVNVINNIGNTFAPPENENKNEEAK